MCSRVLPENATPIDIRAAFALAKVCRQFKLGSYEAMIEAGVTAAKNYPFNAMLAEDQMKRCPHLFVDEPELAAAWHIGVQKQRDFLIELDEIMREAGLEEASLAAEAQYYAQVENDYWDDIYDDCQSQGLVQ